MGIPEGRKAGLWTVQLRVGKLLEDRYDIKNGFVAVKPENLYLIESTKFPKQLPNTKNCVNHYRNSSCRGIGFVPVLGDTYSSDSELGDTTLQRRLTASPLRVEEEASPWVSFLAPLLLILMLVLFMYRKPVQHFFAGNASPCCKGLRSTKQKAPVRHSV